jgi:hypothetical protein
MKKWIYIVLFFSACKPEDSQLADNSAIYGTWAAGEKPVIEAIIFDDDAYYVNMNQEFELVFPDGQEVPFALNGAVYDLQSQRTPQPGERLTLRWFRDADTALVEVDIPPAILDLSVSNDTLNASQSEECSIQWVAPSNEVEYAFRLECIEQNSQYLPWAPGNFATLFSGPQVSTQLQLDPQSFACFGTHRLTISVLNNAMLDAFFYDQSDIRGLLKVGPDNVIGGNGFVSGVSKREVLIEIE